MHKEQGNIKNTKNNHVLIILTINRIHIRQYIDSIQKYPQKLYKTKKITTLDLYIMTVNKEVIDLLRNTIQTNPKIEDLHLDFMHINDLLPYLDLLSQLKSLKSLSLYGNRIKELPMDLSLLASVENLDISNNLLNDIDMLVLSLQTMPNLKILKYPIKKQKQSILIESLKKLTLLNDLHIIRQPSKKALALKHLNQSKLSQFKKQMLRQYKKVREVQQSYLSQKPNENSQQKFINQMQGIIKQSMRQITLKQGDLTQSLELLYFNKTKYQIYDYIKNRYINIAMDIYGDLGKLIKEAWDVQMGIFQSTVKEALKLVKFQYQMIQIQKERKENGGSNMPLENKIYSKNQQLQKQIKRVKKQKDEVLAQMNQLQSENKRYLQSLVRFAKGDKSGFVNLNFGSQAHLSKQNNQSFSNNFPALAPRTTQAPQRSANITRQSIPSNYLSNSRNLTLKQLKETIQQIYESKLKFDQKNFDGKIPRETMHEYLFTYLNQKYGLKNLTIQAASSIVGGIQAYSGEDNDVAVFGKIMRNQIDQEFRNVQSELKTTIYNLLKMHIKTQAPFKSASEIQSLFKQKTNGEISSQQIQDIVKYLYNKSDSDRILHKIDLLYKLNKPKEQHTNRRFTREEVPEKERKKLKFSVFLQTVLDFQLRNHERLLKPLVLVFKARDKDADGIVSQEQFISIVQQLCDQAKDILPEVLMIVDPYETKSITFTQVVRLMANYPENNPILSRYIQKQISEDLQ